MKIKVLGPALPKYFSKYVVLVDFMHGDSDASSQEEFVTESDNDLVDILTMLKEVGKYNEVKLDKLRTKYTKEIQLDVLSEWPLDCTCDDYYASLEQVTVAFYDEKGQNHPVEINKKLSLF